VGSALSQSSATRVSEFLCIEEQLLWKARTRGVAMLSIKQAKPVLPDHHYRNRLQPRRPWRQPDRTALFETMASGTPAVGLDLFGARDSLVAGALDTATSRDDLPSAPFHVLSPRRNPTRARSPRRRAVVSVGPSPLREWTWRSIGLSNSA